MTPDELFHAGRLTDAIAAARQVVTASPADRGARFLLCELLAFAGDLEPIDKHLDVLGRATGPDALAVATFRQLIRAEQARRDFTEQGRVPEFLTQPDEAIQLHLRASIALRDGNQSEAVALLDEASGKLPKAPGTLDDTPFETIRDLDDLYAPVLEVLTSTGKYYWVPFSTIEEMEFRPPQRPRDLLWRRTRLVVAGGPDGEVFIPALYPGSHASPDDAVRLGRQTDWLGGGDGSPCRGVGLRELLVGEDAKSVLELTTLVFPKP